MLRSSYFFLLEANFLTAKLSVAPFLAHSNGAETPIYSLDVLIGNGNGYTRRQKYRVVIDVNWGGLSSFYKVESDACA